MVCLLRKPRSQLHQRQTTEQSDDVNANSLNISQGIASTGSASGICVVTVFVYTRVRAADQRANQQAHAVRNSCCRMQRGDWVCADATGGILLSAGWIALDWVPQESDGPHAQLRAAAWAGGGGILDSRSVTHRSPKLETKKRNPDYY